MSRNKKLKTNRGCKNNAVDREARIFKLNDDCVRYIFSFLPIKQRVRIQRVCKQWQRISQLPWSDVKYLDTSNNYYSIDSRKFKYNLPILKQVLNSCSSSITHITLPDFHTGSGIELFALIKKQCPNVRSIDFNGVTITPRVIRILAGEFKSLIRIKILRSWASCEDSLAQYIANNTCLTHLDIESGKKSVGKYFSKLPECLNEIVIRYAPKVLPAYLSNGLQGLKNLRSLSMDCSLEVLHKFDSFVDALPNKTNLEDLQLSYILMSKTKTKLIHLKNIVQLTNLRKLILRGGLLIHNETLINVGTYCTNLKIVHLHGSFNELSKGWPSFTAELNLEELKLANVTRLPDQCLASMNMDSLKILKCYQCSQVSAETFGNLIRKMDNLERLDVIFCGVFSAKKSYNETLIKNVLAALKSRKNEKTFVLHVLNERASRKVLKMSSLTVIKEMHYNQGD